MSKKKRKNTTAQPTERPMRAHEMTKEASKPHANTIEPHAPTGTPPQDLATPGAPAAGTPEESRRRYDRLKAGGICTAAAICVAMALGFGITNANMERAIDGASDAISTRQAKAEAAHQQLADEVAATHVHNWQADTVLVHHDAIVHEVVHPAVYETVMVPHTVCNICHETIDGATDEHYAKTGHDGYTVGVPMPEEQLKSAEWSETVVDAEAYDELVTETETCTSCGEVRPYERAAGDEA